MKYFKTYKLSELLTQYRETHFIEDNNDYKQLTISKHTGVSYRGTKNGKLIGRKRQFFVNLKKYPHTLLFTRQGVKDGSIGIAPEEVDGCIATENMPMFSINTNVILPDLLGIWLSSDECKTQIDTITPTGSAQKAIHERDLLKIKVSIPQKIEDQKSLIDSLKNQKNKIDYLYSENQYQSSYLTQLRQAILQEAIEGKLTSEWRKENPVHKGDPEFDAEALLEKIKSEKETLIKEGKIKKQKPLAPIKPEDEPFELPEGWVWTRLGEVCSKITDGFHNTPPKKESGIPYIAATQVNENNIDWNNCHYVDERYHKELFNKAFPKKGEILVVNIGAGCGTAAIIDVDYEFSFKNTAILKFNQEIILNKYLLFYFILNRPLIYSDLTKGGLQPFLSLTILNNILIPLPPFTEQSHIVDCVEKLFSMVSDLEDQVLERKTQVEQLMQSVLREAFMGNKED